MSVLSGRVLLVENESIWELQITSALESLGATDVVPLRTYAEAEKQISRINLLDFEVALIDVRMRKQLFDQGGLALLDAVKGRRPGLPVLLLTAYASDYPGIEKVIARYQRVRMSEKEAFLGAAEDLLLGLLKANPRHDVFISYRREGGSDLAQLVRVWLGSRGCQVFLDVKELRTGPFDVALLESIRGSSNFVVLLTPRCFDRCGDEGDWFRREIVCALESGRHIIPLKKEGMDLPAADSLPPDMGRILSYHCVTFSHEYADEAMSKLFSRLTAR